MPEYLIRQIDSALWAAVKARAAREGRTVRGLILLLLQRYVQHGIQEGDDA